MSRYGESRMWLSIIGFYLIFLPFLQLGATYYLSVQMLLFIVLVSCLRLKDFTKNRVLLVVLAVLMITPSFFYTVDDQLHMILGVSRQFLCLAVLLAVLEHSDPVRMRIKNPEIAIITILWFFFVMILVQYVGLKFGYAIHLPSTLFISNASTVIGYEKALALGLYSGVRPSVFYGEPSYLSFVCASLVFIACSTFKSKNNLFLVTILAFSTVALAGSLSGILALFALFSIRFVASIKMAEKMVAFLTIIVFAVLFVALFNQLPFVQRILGLIGLGTGVDISLNIRLFAPFSLISEAFVNFPFGMPKEVLDNVIQAGFESGFKGTDNGFLNLFINFGYFGFLIVGIIFYKIRTNLLLITFVLVSTMFNGAFFSYDKIAVMGMAILIARSMQDRWYVLDNSPSSQFKTTSHV